MLTESLIFGLVAVFTVTDSSILRFQPQQIEIMSQSPDFCNKLDCPEFTVLSKNENYEVRKYVGTHWVSTNKAGADFNMAQYTLFMRLFRYIQGNNVKKEKIEMTTPVLMRITPGQGPTCANNFTMSFFNSPKVPNPPAPSDPTVFLSSMKQMVVYVSSYGGYATKDRFLEHAAKLKSALEKDGVKYVRNYYFTAGYNSPFQLLHRHNEVWFLAE